MISVLINMTEAHMVLDDNTSPIQAPLDAYSAPLHYYG